MVAPQALLIQYDQVIQAALGAFELKKSEIAFASVV
jgi:hypothetical protein